MFLIKASNQEHIPLLLFLHFIFIFVLQCAKRMQLCTNIHIFVETY